MLSGVLLQNNFQRSCWGNESVQNREGGGLYYLVASAVGPNYSYAFLTVSQRHKTFFIAITHFASRHCHTSRRTYWAGRWAWKACAAGTQTCWRPISKTSSQTPKMTKKKQREEETNSRLVDPPTSLMLQPRRKQKGRKEGDASVLHLNEAESFRATAPFMYQQCARAGERKSFRTSVLKRKKIKLIPTCLFIGQNDTNRVTVLPAARFP